MLQWLLPSREQPPSPTGTVMASNARMRQPMRALTPPSPSPLLRPSHTSADARMCAALFVVYDADGTRTGELLYILRKLLGIAHCAACDITHGPRTEKPEFTRLKSAGWNLPVYNIHRDEMDTQLAQAVGQTLPVVVARTNAGSDVVLLGPEQLDECCGSVVTLEASVNAALAGSSLSTPPFPALPARDVLRAEAVPEDAFVPMGVEPHTQADVVGITDMDMDMDLGDLSERDTKAFRESMYRDAVQPSSRERERMYSESLSRQWDAVRAMLEMDDGEETVAAEDSTVVSKKRAMRASTRRQRVGSSSGSEGHGDAVVPDWTT